MNTYITSPLAKKDSFMEQVLTLKDDLTVTLTPHTNFWDSRDSSMKKVLNTAMALLGKAQAELDQKRTEIDSLKSQLSVLEEIATTDPLTGLKNRRGFEQGFNAELDRVRRKKSVGGVLLVIDMDNFKAINDTYGHQAGDACLKLVGKLLSHEVRDMDTAARMGGDEFVILMTDTLAESLLNRIQALIWKLNNLSLVWQNNEIQVSASIGMKPYDENHSAAEIFSCADQNMYIQKQKTKNEQKQK